jgi:hypothetical protein
MTERIAMPLLPLPTRDRTSTGVSLPPRSLRDQGSTVNCCMSCALAACMEALDARTPELSPLSHYFWARRNPHFLGGLRYLEAERAAMENGICTLLLHDPPYDAAGAACEPSSEALRDGATRLLVGRRGLPRLRQMDRSDREARWKQALRSGFPLLLLFSTSAEYLNLSASNPRWTGAGFAVDDHAAAILGFNDDERVQAFIVQDSRGTAFAQQGQWLMPYTELNSPLIRDAYAVGITELDPL